MRPPRPHCVLRPLVAADAVTLSAFLPETMGGEWSAAKVQALLDTPHALRVLEEDGRPVGFAEYQQVHDEAELLALAIAPLGQGRGLGALLLELVLAELRGAGCVRCLLEVRRSNERAQRLYQRAGFRQEGSRKNYYPPLQPGGEAEDALLYSRVLSSS